MGRLFLKRIYEPADATDGRRVLVERLWPRGLKKADAKLDDWLKDIAPSPELRHWYGHDPARWPQFERRYAAELATKADLVDALAARLGTGNVTLLFAARDEARNSAVVLKAALERRLKGL